MNINPEFSLFAQASLLEHIVLGTLLFLTSCFLILLVLVQRGRGGGLTGALGGMGGQSAFGTKAGDLFTRITVGTVLVWILLCIITIQRFREPDLEDEKQDATGISAPVDPAENGDPVTEP